MVNNQLKFDCSLKHKTNIAITRIDNTKDYNNRNIMLICSVINRMRYGMHLLDFMLFCKMISDHQQIKNNNTNKQIKISNEMIRFIDKKYIDLISNANKRDIDVNISQSDIISKYISQNGKCALSGLELSHNKENLNLSVDRIDSNLNYTKDNIQLIVNILNKSKIDYTNDEYINLCKTILTNKQLNY